MAWEATEWACGHNGSMQLYGKMVGRHVRIAYEAGKKCLACWLISQWIEKNDPRAENPKRWELATSIAEGKGISIRGAEIMEEVVEHAETTK